MSEPNEKIEKINLERLSKRQLMELDACTRCGECVTWCPVYEQDQKEEITPRSKALAFKRILKAQHGLMATMLNPGGSLSKTLGTKLLSYLSKLIPLRGAGDEEIKNFANSLYECSVCGQCHVVCPSGIDTGALWESIRGCIVDAGYGPLDPQKPLVASVKAYDNPWQQPRIGRTKWAKWAKKENLIADLPKDIKKTEAKVLLFIGCTASFDVNVNRIAISTINILEKLGIEYGELGKDEKCCGSVLRRMGDPEFERLATENIKVFNNLGITTLITSCAGCFNTIRNDYPRVGKLNFEVLSTSQFLCRLWEEKKLPLVLPVEKRVTYHDPCHLGRANQVFDEPREILRAIPGIEVVEMERNYQNSRCCGAGGGVKAGFPAIQNKMAQARIKEAEKTGAIELVSACPFCYQGLQVGIKELNSPLVMRDITELVAMSLDKK